MNRRSQKNSPGIARPNRVTPATVAQLLEKSLWIKDYFCKEASNDVRERNSTSYAAVDRAVPQASRKCMLAYFECAQSMGCYKPRPTRITARQLLACNVPPINVLPAVGKTRQTRSSLLSSGRSPIGSTRQHVHISCFADMQCHRICQHNLKLSPLTCPFHEIMILQQNLPFLSLLSRHGLICKFADGPD